MENKFYESLSFEELKTRLFRLHKIGSMLYPHTSDNMKKRYVLLNI